MCSSATCPDIYSTRLWLILGVVLARPSFESSPTVICLNSWYPEWKRMQNQTLKSYSASLRDVLRERFTLKANSCWPSLRSSCCVNVFIFIFTSWTEDGTVQHRHVSTQAPLVMWCRPRDGWCCYRRHIPEAFGGGTWGVSVWLCKAPQGFKLNLHQVIRQQVHPLFINVVTSHRQTTQPRTIYPVFSCFF